MLFVRIVAGVALILGALALGLSFGLPKGEGPGPELFPRILGLTLILAGGWLGIQPGSAELGEESKEKLIGWIRALLFCLLLLLTPLAVPRLGLGTSAALVGGLAAWLHGESWTRILGVAGVLWFLNYLIFIRILGVPG